MGDKTLGSVPGFSGRRRCAEGGILAARPHGSFPTVALAALAAGLVVCSPGVVRAGEAARDSSTWYIVGGPEEIGTTDVDRLAAMQRPPRIDFGLTFSRVAAGDIISFTSGPTPPRPEGSGGYAFLVSGAYDFETGTLVTPRIVGGVGVSYLPNGSTSVLAENNPTTRQDMTPTAHIGFGADFDLGDTWAVSAEYRALYLGETEREGRLNESRLDQKFTVGARIRF